MEKLVAVVLPQDLAEGTQSFVSRWLRQPGETVALHEPLLEVSSDKATVEVASPASGVLKEIVKLESEQIQPGEVLGHIATSNADVAATPIKSTSIGATASAPAASGSNDTLSPAVRSLLKEHGLQASQIRGSGKDGRITHQDVLDFVASGAKSARPVPTVSRVPSRKIPHTPLRRMIAKHMADSLVVAPHVTAVFEADLQAISDHRAKNKEAFTAKGVQLTYTAYFVQAAAKALQAVPEVNGCWHDDALEVFDDCNIGVGTAMTQPDGSAGIVVPVLHRAQTLDLFGIATKLQELTERARQGKQQPQDMQDGTFTISNHGTGGSLLAAPIIINQPQVAILGIGKIEKRVVVREKNGKDTTDIRLMAYVTLSLDHRALDAHHANRFLTTFVETLATY